MPGKRFVHLHLHTHYSILDGVCQVPNLLDRAKELGMREIAITDHGAMFGVVEFYVEAVKRGIKPIIGFEAYVAPGSRSERNAQGIRDASHHLTLLAKNSTGYKNLSRLCTLGYTEGFYYRPRVDKEILRECSEGIIALSGCLKGEVNQNLLNGRQDEAENAARTYADIFGKENFFLEVMNNGMEEQLKVIPPIQELSRKTGIPLVATSDVHYINPEHAKVQEVLICINTGKKLSDEKRMRMQTDDFFLKSEEQMLLCFKGMEEACERTVGIAERCNLELELEGFHLPHLDPPQGMSTPEYLDSLCMAGLKRRYGDPLPQKVIERYKHETTVINKMGFPSYFLIVWDLVNFARENGIAVGPGRGSAAGSIVSYALGITNLDPLKYGLLFERFLNEGRNEMPDIDLDFDKERRSEIIDHIINRHGRDQCAQIVTFGCLSAKSAIRDVGRVMDIPLQDVDVIAKMIPDMVKPKGNKNSIQVSMDLNPDLRSAYEQNAETRELLDIAGQLDGVIRQTGTHACGVLVADKPIIEYGPLAKRGEDITTQYEQKMLEKMGLCKIDVLGLETLTLLRKAVSNVKRSRNIDVDLDHIPLDDKETFRMLQHGDAKGVFQFESSGMRALLVKLGPDRFEDLIAAVAMYRPGPLGAGLVDKYIACKHGKEDPHYLHPLMEPILRETHGLILYQEQVQALALELAHFTLSEGDKMRRAMGKKVKAIMDEYREKFIDNARDTVGENIAEKIFDQIDYFAGYGFNKSHSACYAFIAYQTAYMKCHFPREYMAALLTVNRGETKKVVEYIEDCRKMGIDVLPPDINESDVYFTVSGNAIRFGLSAVKGVGDKAVEGLVKERDKNGPIKSLYDFCERVDLRLLNRGAIEAFIKAGAFDSLAGHRAQYIAALDRALAAGNTAQKERASGQMGLFAGMDELPEPELPEVPKWHDQKLLAMEKDVLGFYVSSHPLARHADQIRAFATCGLGDLARMEDQATVTIGGLIAGVKLRMDKHDKRYAMLVLEDIDGAITVFCFNKTYEKVKDLLQEDRIVFIIGKVSRRKDDPAIFADDVIALERAEECLTRSVIIKLDSAGLERSRLQELKELLMAHQGNVPLRLHIKTHNRCLVDVRTSRGLYVKPSRHLTEDINRFLGEGHLVYNGKAAG